ncbi:hypothetical protein CDAR_245661 [Caerostris darwini]|uniref:RNase H type-1 domain-containing protein n=1 Tax=Caerostris darwini TaxID=1538125 RepID=A0AAV4UPD9_9ARAC|nr:hypothetical protein CDAR_245661 [Caerostris darwini]
MLSVYLLIVANGSTDSGIFITTSNNTSFPNKFKNVDHCLGFRSELTKVEGSLTFLKSAEKLEFMDIWILADSRSSIQYFSNWMTVGERPAHLS